MVSRQVGTLFDGALLHYPDYRVKISAAETLWPLTADAESLVPIFVDALNDRAVSLNTIESAI